MGTTAGHGDEDYRSAVRDAVRDPQAFVRLTLSARRGEAVPWTRITLRPVLIRGRRHVQFAYFDGRQTTITNVALDALDGPLDRALDGGFTQIHLETTAGDAHLRITKKGRALVSRGWVARAAPDLAHDRAKPRLLPADRPDPLLAALGLQDGEGRLRPAMRGKFLQINEFLRVLDRVVPEPAGRPVEIVDCGSGSAYLTFAAFHYLNHVRGLPARLVGIDVNPALVEKSLGLRDALGWSGLAFRVSPIAAFRPDAAPDVVLSLHACDTATDDAIVQGIRWGSRAILAAPCCQHELHHTLHAGAFRAVLRHGVLRERLADLVTDAFRAQVLRIMGYAADVIQFVSPDATSKNLMIRAEKRAAPGDAAAVGEYLALRTYWDVVPYIEAELAGDLARYLDPAPAAARPEASRQGVVAAPPSSSPGPETTR